MDQSHQKDSSRKDRSVDGHMASLREIWPDAVALYTVVRPLNGPRISCGDLPARTLSDVP